MNKVIINTSSVTSKYTTPDQMEKVYETTSNESRTENMSVAFVKDKSSMHIFGSPNDEIQQNLLLTNESASTIDNIRIKETIGSGASFKTGSVTIDDQSYPDMNIVEGITLPNSIASNAGVTVSYILVIDATPEVDSVALKSNITYDVNEVQDLSEDTAELEISITENKIVIEKTSGQSAVISGSELVYQNVIRNIGNIKNTEVFFKDTIPEGTTFVPGSVKINKAPASESYDPAVGFDLGELDVNSEIEVTFTVKVN